MHARINNNIANSWYAWTVCRLFCCKREINKGYYAELVIYCVSLLSYNNDTKEVSAMTARERILAIKLLEKQERNPEYVKKIGVQVSIAEKALKKKDKRKLE